MKIFLAFLIVSLSSCNAVKQQLEDIFSPDIVIEEEETGTEDESHPHTDTRDGDIYDWRETMKEKVLTCYDWEDDFTNYDKVNPAALMVICQAAKWMGYDEVVVTSDWRKCSGKNRSRHCGDGAFDFFFGAYTGNDRENDRKYETDAKNLQSFLSAFGLLEVAGFGIYPPKRIFHFDLRGNMAQWCEKIRGEPYVGIRECLEDVKQPELDLG